MSDGGVFTGTVSIKGVVVRDGLVLLVHNERDEWELPGGRLELDETPPQCVAREIAEETGWRVTTGPCLDSWLYWINAAEKHVLIVTYGVHLDPGQGDVDPVVSHEHSRIGLFPRVEVPGLNMPQGYKDSIEAWFAHLDGNAAAAPATAAAG